MKNNFGVDYKNSLVAIKEFREYSSRDDFTQWQEYVLNVFYLLGFSKNHIDANIFELRKNMGDKFPCAVLVIVPYLKQNDEGMLGAYWTTFLTQLAKVCGSNLALFTDGGNYYLVEFDRGFQIKHKHYLKFDEIIDLEDSDQFRDFFEIIIENDGVQALENIKYSFESFSKSYLKVLKYLYNNGNLVTCNTSDIRRELGVSLYANYSKLAYPVWGLINKDKGRISITPKGIKFLRGDIKIPRRIMKNDGLVSDSNSRTDQGGLYQIAHDSEYLHVNDLEI